MPSLEQDLSSTVLAPSNKGVGSISSSLTWSQGETGAGYLLLKEAFDKGQNHTPNSL